MTRKHLRQLDPFRLHGLALPPQLVLIARLLVVTLLLLGDRPFARHLPYLPFLDDLGTSPQFHTVLVRAMLVGCILILFGPFTRVGCALVGVTYLVGLLGCRPCLSVAHTYVAVMFIMLALSSRFSGTRLIRWQLVMLYAGAGINKLVDRDWWDGDYFTTYMVDRHAHELYAEVAGWLPGQTLSVAMGIATIVTELLLVVLFLRRRWHAAGIWIGATFHGVMVLLLDITFGPFVAAILLSYLAFVTWPERAHLTVGATWPQRALRQAVGLLDRSEVFQFRQVADDGVAGLSLEVGGLRRTGPAALFLVVALQPLAYVVLLAGLVKPDLAGIPRFAWTILILAALTAAIAVARRPWRELPDPA